MDSIDSIFYANMDVPTQSGKIGIVETSDQRKQRLQTEEENIKLAYEQLRELLYQYGGEKENVKQAFIRLQESEFWALKKTAPEV